MRKLSQVPLPDTETGDDVAAASSASAAGNPKVVLGLPLPHRATFYPLGFAVEFATNEEKVLDIIDQHWGNLRRLHANPPLQVRIEVREGDSEECPPAPVIRLQRNLFTWVADAHNHAVCDLRNELSAVWLSYAALEQRKYVYYHFIETAASILITTTRTTALHAACVSRHGHGMLLSADSGVGKSTLSYACAREGWTFTSDDGSFLLHDGKEPRVVGNCRQVRFRPTAKELFPELRGYDLTPRIQGKPSIEIPTSELGLITADQATIRSVVFLKRQRSAVAELVSLPRGSTVQRFRDQIDPFEEVREAQLETLQQLVDVDAYELTYWDLEPAIARLNLLARGTGTPIP